MRPLRPLLETCTWKHVSASSLYGPTYTTTTINCSINFVSKQVHTINADTIVCSALVTCYEAVMPGDILTLTDPGSGDARDFPVKGLVKVANAINPEVPFRIVAL